MPPSDQSGPLVPLQQVVEEVGVYPIEAYHFVHAGLNYTVEKIHADPADPEASRHVSGQQLCEGLREYALLQYGMMAPTVLRRWNITCTFDFGRIVFALIEFGHMAKTDQDTIEDFRNVFDFTTGFAGYRIECAS